LQRDGAGAMGESNPFKLHLAITAAIKVNGKCFPVLINGYYYLGELDSP